MPLQLNLSDSRAKIDRARDQLDALEHEVPAFTEEMAPYTFRLSAVDAATGWCSIWRVPLDPPWKRRLSLVAGSVHHNLRSALNSIVVELAHVSGIEVSTEHHFPIFKSREVYRAIVGFPQPHGHGPLLGIQHGLVEIEALQPYEVSPGVEGNLPSDLLWHLERFSDAAKSRSITTMTKPQAGSMQILSDGIELEWWYPPGRQTWEPDAEQEIARVRYARPYPTQMQLHWQVGTELLFAIPPLAGETQSLGHDLPFLHAISEHVSTIVSQFEAL